MTPAARSTPFRTTFAGRSHVHWLTGTASTVMVGCVEGILGLRPTTEGIEISPAIPADELKAENDITVIM